MNLDVADVYVTFDMPFVNAIYLPSFSDGAVSFEARKDDLAGVKGWV